VLARFDALGYKPFRICTDGTLEATTREHLDAWLLERRAEMNFVFKKSV
jgi:hypothetical protein